MYLGLCLCLCMTNIVRIMEVRMVSYGEWPDDGEVCFRKSTLLALLQAPWWLRRKNIPPSVSRLSRHGESLTFHSPRLATDIDLLYLYMYVYIIKAELCPYIYIYVGEITVKGGTFSSTEYGAISDNPLFCLMYCNLCAYIKVYLGLIYKIYSK
jgi:hypothetical protein